MAINSSNMHKSTAIPCSFIDGGLKFISQEVQYAKVNYISEFEKNSL